MERGEVKYDFRVSLAQEFTQTPDMLRALKADSYQYAREKVLYHTQHILR